MVPRNAAVPTGKFCKLTPATVDVKTLFMNAIIKTKHTCRKGAYHYFVHAYVFLLYHFFSYVEFHVFESLYIYHLTPVVYGKLLLLSLNKIELVLGVQ